MNLVLKITLVVGHSGRNIDDNLAVFTHFKFSNAGILVKKKLFCTVNFFVIYIRVTSFPFIDDTMLPK